MCIGCQTCWNHETLSLWFQYFEIHHQNYVIWMKKVYTQNWPFLERNFAKNLKISQRLKRSWKFVYTVAWQLGFPLKLTNFFGKKSKSFNFAHILDFQVKLFYRIVKRFHLLLFHIVLSNIHCCRVEKIINGTDKPPNLPTVKEVQNRLWSVFFDERYKDLHFTILSMWKTPTTV